MNLIGAGGHARVVIDTLEEAGISIDTIWDDNLKLNLLGKYSVKHNVLDYTAEEGDEFIVAIGNNKIRHQLVRALEKSKFGQAIHPKSYISKHSIIGSGTVVMANCTVNVDCHIGQHVILNTNSSVDHDCKLGDFVHISPNAALAGNVTVGEGTHIGIGASIIQNINIGKWAVIGAGAVIINNIPDYAVVVGAPGKVLKYI